MTSLHYYGRPKKSRQEVTRSMSTIPLEQIPLEIIVPAYNTTTTTTSSSSTTSTPTTTKASNTTPFSTAASTNDNRRTILIVRRLNIVGNNPIPDIIHIHSSSSLSRAYYPLSSTLTHTMSSLLSSRSIDNKSAHSNDKSSRHAVGCASSASNASSSHQLLRHQKDELLTTKPIWSPSGNILLLNALERLSKRKIATNNYIDPYPTTTSTSTSTSTRTTTTTVLVCGLVTSVCVLQTANACREAGYTTHLIEDLVFRRRSYVEQSSDMIC